MLNPEHVLIPFEAADLPPSPWLVFVPHADDETFGMGGTLLRAKQENIEVHLVIVTDGALGGSATDLVATRMDEINAAAELLGVSSLAFWAVPDRGVVLEDSLVERAVGEIMDKSPATVFFPGAMEIHPDHRATGLIAWAALQKIYNEYQLRPQVISYEITVQNPVNMIIDVTAQKSAKEQVMQVYASQNSENNYQELVLALDKGRTFSLPAEVKYAEGFYLYTEADIELSFQQVIHKIVDKYI